MIFHFGFVPRVSMLHLCLSSCRFEHVVPNGNCPCLYAYLHVCMYVSVFDVVRVFVLAFVYSSVYVYAYLHVQVYVYAYRYACVYAYV